MSYDARFRVWRGDASGGDLQDFTVEVNEGEVVLDIIHRLQATQAGDLAVRWNCKAGKCGSCSAEINGRPAADVHDPDEHLRRGRDRDRHPAARLPGHPRPGHRRLVQLRARPRRSRRSPPAPRRRRQPPDAAGRRRALAGVPQVHRVLALPGHLPRHPRPRGEQGGVSRVRGS